MQHEKADDFIVATGKSISVRSFVELCFNYINYNIEWDGEGINEKALNNSNGEILVEVKQIFFRPLEIEFLEGDYSKIKNEIGWYPKTDIKKLVEIMMEAELKEL